MSALLESLDIDIALVSIFLVMTLIVGIYHGRRVKDLRDYALGGKNFATSTLATTIIATWASGGALFTIIENTYSRGLYFMLTILGVPLSIWLSGQFLAVRMEPFMNNVSVAEAMGDMYGKGVRIITSITAIGARIGFTAIQFKVMGTMLASVLHLDKSTLTIVAACIVLVYTTFGGVRSVTFTDILQFFTFGLLIPILALSIWNNMQGPQVAHTLMNNPNFDLKTVVGWTPRFMATLGLFCSFAIPGYSSPELFQRVAMARDVYQAKDAFTYAAGIFLLMFLLEAWIGILLLADNPNIAPPNQVVPYLIEHHVYTGLKGLLGVGILALAMSTADSVLNACAVLFANDVIKPLAGKDKGTVLTARILALFSGLAALVLALYSTDLLKLILFCGSFYMPIVTIPLLMAVLGFRTSTRAVLISMATGIITVLLWSILGNNSDSIVPGMLANFVGLMGSHYLLREKGGWLPLDPNSALALVKAARREAWQRRIEAVRRFRLSAYLQQNLPKQERFYMLFGFYLFTASYASLYILPTTIGKQYKLLYEWMQYSLLVLVTVFILYPLWPLSLKRKRVLVWVWPASLCYGLFFVGAMLALMNDFDQLHVMILVLNLVMATLLIQWPLSISLVIIGMLAAASLFQYSTGCSALPGSLEFRLIYGLLLFSSFLIALFKYQEYSTKVEDRNALLVGANQETNQALLAAYREMALFIKTFRESGASELGRLVGLSKKILAASKVLKLPAEITQDLTQVQDALSTIALHLDKLDQRAVGYMHLETTTVSITSLQEAVQEAVRTKKGLSTRIKWEKLTQYNALECDVTKIEALLVNSISYMQEVGVAALPILVGIEDTQLGYPMSAVKPGYTKKIAALRITLTTQNTLPVLEPCYLAQMGKDTFGMPKTMRALLMLANERILRAHYGYTNTADHGQKDLALVYVIPVKLREVRPKDMELPEVALGAKRIYPDDTYPGAQEQEANFLQAVQERTQADMKLVREALELAKTYHGSRKRNSGEPFYLHPLAVAQIVLDYNQDEATVLGALLHDLVEDTSLTPEQIEMRFGQEVRDVVVGVTHFNNQKDTIYKVKLSPHENLTMILEKADKRVFYVKLADRLHNMRTIQYKHYDRQQRTAEETLMFFVPLAERLGLQEVAVALKELCFAVLTGPIYPQQ